MPTARQEHADELRLDIGEIDTTWVVYGTRKRFQGEVVGFHRRRFCLERPLPSVETPGGRRPPGVVTGCGSFTT